MVSAVHVVSGIGHEASGLAYCVPRLCRGLSETGIQVKLFSCDSSSVHLDKIDFTTFPTKGPFRSKTGYSPSLYARLLEVAPTTNIIHNHHLWMLPNVYPAYAIRHTNCKLITSLHGTLAPEALKHSRWRKRVMWYACQSKVLTRSSCLVATSEAEYEDIRRLKLRNPIAIVPHSYDLPEVFDHLVLDGRRRVLYLGRIHPIKGLHNLVEAWAKIENRFPEWELHMVGPGLPKHVEDLQGLIKSKGLTRAVLRDGVYGEEKAREYRQAELFVLTSFSENFAMTVAESLGYQVPAIVSKGAPWKGIEEHQCGWWIDIGVDPLVNALEVACSRSPAHLGAMGKLGRTWVGDEFHWRKLANQMRDVYAWVLGDGPIPDAVRTD